MSRSRKIFLSVTLVMLLVVMLFLGFITASQTVTTGAQFFMSPSDATVRINDTPLVLNNNSQVKLDPGLYEAEIVRLHFNTINVVFEVKQNEITEVVGLLNPLNSEGDSHLLTEKEVGVRESVSYRLTKQKSQKIAQDTPIINFLPAQNEVFRIDYGISKKYPEDPTKVSITITTESEEARNEALDWIRSKGADPATLEIYYKFY